MSSNRDDENLNPREGPSYNSYSNNNVNPYENASNISSASQPIYNPYTNTSSPHSDDINDVTPLATSYMTKHKSEDHPPQYHDTYSDTNTATNHISKDKDDNNLPPSYIPPSHTSLSQPLSSLSSPYQGNNQYNNNLYDPHYAIQLEQLEEQRKLESTIVVTKFEIPGLFPDPNLLSSPLEPKYNIIDNIPSHTFEILPTPIQNHYEMFYQRRYLGDTSHLEAMYGTRNPHMNQYKPGDTAVDLLAPQGHYPLPGTPYLSVLTPQHNIADLSVRLGDGQSDTKPKIVCCTAATCFLHAVIPISLLILIGTIILCIISGIWAFVIIAIAPLFTLLFVYIAACSPRSQYRESEIFESVTFPLDLASEDGKIFNINDIPREKQNSQDIWKGYKMRIVPSKLADTDTIINHINTIRREVPVFAFLVVASHMVPQGKSSRRQITCKKWVHIPIMAFNSYGETAGEFVERVDHICQVNNTELLVTYEPNIHFKTGDDTITKDEYIKKVCKMIKTQYVHLDKMVDVLYAPFTQQPGLNHRWTRTLYSSDDYMLPSYRPRTSLENTIDIYSASSSASSSLLSSCTSPRAYNWCTAFGCSPIWLCLFMARYKQIRYQMHYDIQLPTTDSIQTLLEQNANALDLRTYIPLNGSNTDPYVQEWIEASSARPHGRPQDLSNVINNGPIKGPQW